MRSLLPRKKLQDEPLNTVSLFPISAPRALSENKQELCGWASGRLVIGYGGNKVIFFWFLEKPGTMEKMFLPLEARVH